MIKKTIEQVIELTPEELASEFCNSTDGEQSAFFNEISKITGNWKESLGFKFQLQYVTDNAELTDGGREIMALIGQYSDKSKG
jgi:hypothetical protein